MTQGNQDIINYSMACRTTDLFSSLEERLYQDFPKYRNVDKIFMVRANRIFRDKKIMILFLYFQLINKFK